MNSGGFTLSPLGSFPLSADPNFQDEVRDELAELVRQVRESGAAKCFVGLILTGSFARGEGTLAADPRAGTRWLSDIECLVVFNGGIVPTEEVRRALRKIEDEINSNPSSRARGVKVELRAITSQKLERLSPTIFTRELSEHGKLLWGSTAALPMPRRCGVGDDAVVSRQDAFRLLNNRIIEQIAARNEITGDAGDSTTAAYSLAKFWIDLGTSLSIFFGCYRPGYRSRQGPFEDSLRLHAGSLGTGVSDRLLGHYRNAMALKLGQKKLAPVASIYEFSEAAEIAHVAWNWESGQLLGCGPRSGDWRLIFSRLSRLETPSQRFRDWSRLLRRPASLRSLGPRALCAAVRAGSFATLIYGTGCVLDFFWDEIGTETGAGSEIAAALCPALNIRAAPPLERRRMLTRAALRAWEAHLRFAAA